MKNILIIDEAEVIRDFLSNKLTELGFQTETAQNGLDGFMKLRSFDPDLVIMDYYLTRLAAVDLLKKKAADPNLKNIPVILASGKISREILLELSRYGIRKFITKPIKIDSLVEALNEQLGLHLELDNTPCIIDANYNEEVLFIEVAQGLNSEKIEMLRYRIQELIGLYQIEVPKVLLMLSGIEITDGDSLKFLSLITGICDAGNVQHKNFKILTTASSAMKFASSR